MASIIPYLPRGVFDDETTKAMGEAFDAACKALHPSGKPEKVAQNAVARRIISATQKGERDVTRLSAAALTGLAADLATLLNKLPQLSNLHSTPVRQARGTISHCPQFAEPTVLIYVSHDDKYARGWAWMRKVSEYHEHARECRKMSASMNNIEHRNRAY